MNKKVSPIAKLSALSLLCLSVSGFIQASDEKPTSNDQIKPWVSERIKPAHVKIDLNTIQNSLTWRPGEAIKNIPRRRFKPNYVKPSPPKNKVLSKIDSLMQKQRALAESSMSNNRAVEQQFEGGGYTGVNPPDTTGDVGLDYYIQAINSSSGSIFRVYDKDTGALVTGPINMETLGTGNCATGAGDPIVLFDEMANRWLLSEFSSFGNNLCVYISQTSDPISGGWFAYSFASPTFPDYPKYGVGVDAYYVGTNESNPTVYALDRTAMLAGSAAAMVRLEGADLAGFGFQMIQPADHEGSTPMPAGTPGYFLRHRDDEVHNAGSNNPLEDYVELWAYNVDFVNTANSTFTKVDDFAVAEFDSDLCGLFSFFCFPQAGSTTTLDPLREVVMHRVQYRNFGSYETIIGNFVTDVDGTDHGGIRWFELRRQGGSWSLFQEGTYSPDSKNRWMGSIAMDKDGNIALAYSWGSSIDFPGIRYTGRLAGDASGVMTEAETTLVVGTDDNASNRWGDYSHLALDPEDECTFWYTNQYGKENGQWGTHIASFKFDSCGGGNIPPTASFTFSCTELSCNFDGSASSDSDGTIESYNWDFGDGGNDVGATPAYNFSSGGTYTVTLTVTDDLGATGSTSQQVTVNTANVDPVADFSFAVNDLSVDFTDLSGDSDGTITNWDWDFGDSGISSAQNPTYEYASAGTYTVSLTVTDDDGATNTSSQDVTVTDPVGGTSDGWTENNVSFDAGQLISYTIEVPAGADRLEVDTAGGSGDVDLVIKLGSTPSRFDNDCIQIGPGTSHNCTIDNPGAGTWFIIVRGAQASSEIQVDAYWFSSGGSSNQAPTADFSFSPNDLEVIFTDASSDSDGSVTNWSWDFGDGGSSTSQNPVYTYGTAGSYDVTLTVTDDDGATDFSTQTVTVTSGGGTTGGWTETNVSPNQGQLLEYSIEVPAGATTLEVDTSGGTGDVDVALKFGALPTPGDNDCFQTGFGNVHNCTIINPQAGTWYIRVRGAQASSGVQLDAYWTQ